MANKQVFNPRAFDELIELEESGSEGLVNSLIEDYIPNSQSLVEAISESFAKGDFATTERSAHSLKSSSAVLGLEVLAADAYLMEEDAREKRYDPNRFTILEHDLKLAHAALLEFLALRKLEPK